jgi:F-type H+-transporting ATPase subunit gamma
MTYFLDALEPIRMQAFVGTFTAARGGFVSARRDAFLCGAGQVRPAAPVVQAAPQTLVMSGKTTALRGRIRTIKNTQKITEAMRLVAAAKVRRAQDAVLRTRPFSDTLQKVLGGLLSRLNSTEYFDLPLLKQRETKKVLLVAISGDRGLCGSYNSSILRKLQLRINELKAQSLEVELVTVGSKVTQWARRRNYKIRRSFLCTQQPTSSQATEIADVLLAAYLGDDVQRVELLYTRFVSLISSKPSIRTMLPLTPVGLEMEGDEIFQLTTEEGKFAVKRSFQKPSPEAIEITPDMIFEQDPLQLLNALLPLYFNGQLLRTLQESVAGELAARMSAMSSASDNAKELARKLNIEFNRARQSAITSELAEIVGGAAALEG